MLDSYGEVRPIIPLQEIQTTTSADLSEPRCIPKSYPRSFVDAVDVTVCEDAEKLLFTSMPRSVAAESKLAAAVFPIASQASRDPLS